MVPKCLGTEVSVKPAKAVRVRVAPHLGWQPSRDTETDVLYYDECNKIHIACAYKALYIAVTLLVYI